MPFALCKEFSKLTTWCCAVIFRYIVGQACLICSKIGSSCVVMGIMSLNHRVMSSLMALTKGCPFGPYATHNAVYLHLELLNPTALAAAISILPHSFLDNHCTWHPQVALEKPAPEKGTLTFLEILVSCDIL